MKRFLSLWFAGASLVAFGIGQFNVPLLYRLTRRGVTTCGTVTGFEPNNHRTVHYSYQVNDKIYSGAQEGGVGGETSASSNHCGGNVVFYLPERPDVSCIGDPAPMLKNEIIPIALAMLFIPPFSLLSARSRYPAFRRWLRAGTQSPD